MPRYLEALRCWCLMTTKGLDPLESRDQQLIVELKNQGHTIIMASHLLDELGKGCTHAAILKPGT